MSGIESSERSESRFVFPSFEHVEGEIERVKKYFDIQSPDFVRTFLERAQSVTLSRLEDAEWETLENTDSRPNDLFRGDWDAVTRNAGMTGRDWKSLKEKMQQGTPLDAPIIARRGSILHLVSGNTRLMVARALGIKPDVLIVDITGLE